MIHTDYHWEIREREGLLVVRLAGEIDHHNAVRLRGDVDELLLGKRPRRLVLDLSRVDFMDSAGVGFLMGRYRLMQELGGVLAVKSPTPRVEKMLRLCGMERFMEIDTDRKETER